MFDELCWVYNHPFKGDLELINSSLLEHASSRNMTRHFRLWCEGFFPGFLRSARMLAQSMGFDMRGDVEQHAAQLGRGKRIVSLPRCNRNGSHHPRILRADLGGEV